MPAQDWTDEEAGAVLAAMAAVGTADGALGPVERELVSAAADHVFGVDVDVDALAPVTPETVAAAVVDDDKRRMAAQLLVLVPYADMAVEAVEVGRVDAYAAALGVAPDSLRDLHRVRAHHLTRLVADYGRRAFGVFGANSPYGPVRTFARAAHQYVGDTAVAARYDALADLPEGSLGRTFHGFYRARGFPLPGEAKSMGELLVAHDAAHILGGFNTDASGEIDVAGFEAGMSRTGFGYEMLMEVLLDFQLGINLGASSVGIEVTTGQLHPDSMMTGIRRGLDCNVDLIADWDFWSAAHRPVLELRDEYGIAGAGPVVLAPPPTQAQA